jgi:hypothetical protein
VALRVAVFISDHINNTTGKTFLGGQRIAGALGVSRATVVRAVGELAERGHLSVTPGGGRDKANEYRLKLGNCSPNGQYEPEKQSTGETVTGGETVNSGGETVSSANGNCLTSATTTSTSYSDGYYSHQGEHDFYFEFEEAYGFEPWMARAPAQKLFSKLSSDEQVAATAGAGHYAADCLRQRRKKQNPKNWLADRGWEGFVPTGDTLAKMDKLARELGAAKDITPGTPEWRAYRARVEAARAKGDAW